MMGFVSLGVLGYNGYNGGCICILWPSSDRGAVFFLFSMSQLWKHPPEELSPPMAHQGLPAWSVGLHHPIVGCLAQGEEQNIRSPTVGFSAGRGGGQGGTKHSHLYKIKGLEWHGQRYPLDSQRAGALQVPLGLERKTRPFCRITPST